MKEEAETRAFLGKQKVSCIIFLKSEQTCMHSKSTEKFTECIARCPTFYFISFCFISFGAGTVAIHKAAPVSDRQCGAGCQGGQRWHPHEAYPSSQGWWDSLPTLFSCLLEGWHHSGGVTPSQRAFRGRPGLFLVQFLWVVCTEVCFSFYKQRHEKTIKVEI